MKRLWRMKVGGHEYRIAFREFAVLFWYSQKYHVDIKRLLCAYGQRVKL